MKLKKIIILLLIISTFSMIIFSEALRSFESSLNPALLESTGNRSFFELVVSPDLLIYQNAYSTSEMFSWLSATKITFDFNELYTSLNGADLTFYTKDNIDGHFVANIFGFGVGAVVNVDLKSDLNFPNDLVKLIAEGNEIGKTDEGLIAFDLDSSIKAGLYGSYNFDSFSVGLTYNFFMPILYSKDTNINYIFSTEDGTLTAELNTKLELYSSFNDEELGSLSFNSFTDKLFSNGGQSIDIGVTFGKPKNPTLGVAVKNIGIKPANVTNEITYNETITLFGDDSEESSPTTVSQSVSQEYSYPLGVTGFVRIPVLVLDVIPYGEYYFEGQTFNWGLKAKTSLLNLLSLSLGIENYYDFWNLSLGFGINSRIFESRSQFSFTDKELTQIFDMKSLSFKTSIALGF